MRRELVFGTVFAAAMAVGVGAQTYGTQSRDTHSKNEITVTGCLQSGDEAGSTAATTGTTGSTTAGTAGSMASSASGAKFKLTNVSMGSASTTTSGATAGTTGTTGAGASAASEFPNGLQLVASSDSKDSDWSKYLDHKVEVKGNLESNSGASSMGAATTTAGGSTAGSSAASESPASSPSILRVSSIRSISDTCSGH